MIEVITADHGGSQTWDGHVSQPFLFTNREASAQKGHELHSEFSDQTRTKAKVVYSQFGFCLFGFAVFYHDVCPNI